MILLKLNSDPMLRACCCHWLSGAALYLLFWLFPILDDLKVLLSWTGSVVKRDCTPQSGTRCVPCVDGTYMDQPNTLTKCFPCSSCDQGTSIISWVTFHSQDTLLLLYWTKLNRIKDTKQLFATLVMDATWFPMNLMTCCEVDATLAVKRTVVIVL